MMNRSSLNHSLLLASSLVLLTWGSLCPAQAQSLEQMARVDISAVTKSPIPFEVLSVSEGAKAEAATWAGASAAYVVQLPATTQWQKGTITIKPAKSGNLCMTLLGPYIQVEPETKNLKPVFIEYDAVEGDTVVIKNGGFEDTNSAGSPNGWYPVNVPTSDPPLDSTNTAAVVSSEAPEGTHFLRVWHNSRFGQTFFVEENVPVKITFMYRLMSGQ